MNTFFGIPVIVNPALPPGTAVLVSVSSCPNCGGTMFGDGFTVVRHCEFAETFGIEPDANPVHCTPGE